MLVVKITVILTENTRTNLTADLSMVRLPVAETASVIANTQIIADSLQRRCDKNIIALKKAVIIIYKNRSIEKQNGLLMFQRRLLRNHQMQSHPSKVSKS